MVNQRQHLGIARVREIKGQLVLFLPRAVVRLFGLKVGDVAVFRTRHGTERLYLTFRRNGKRLRLLHSTPSLLQKKRP
jgi:hypothetical protein